MENHNIFSFSCGPLRKCPENGLPSHCIYSFSPYPAKLYKGGCYKYLWYTTKHIISEAIKFEDKQVQVIQSPLHCFGVEQ